MKRIFLAILAASIAALAAPQEIAIDFGGQRPPQGVQVSTDNTWTQDDAVTFYDPASSATVTFQVPAGTDVSGWTMKVTDRISITGAGGAPGFPGGQGTVFPSFVLNGRNISTQAIPWNAFTSTSYPVGQYLRPGKNVLQITATVTETVNEYQIERVVFSP